MLPSRRRVAMQRSITWCCRISWRWVAYNKTRMPSRPDASSAVIGQPRIQPSKSVHHDRAQPRFEATPRVFLGLGGTLTPPTRVSVGTLDAYKCCGSSPDALAVSRPLTQCRIHPIWFSDHSAPA
eukprot:1456672-Pyramimonas_sp.AAC.1